MHTKAGFTVKLIAKLFLLTEAERINTKVGCTPTGHVIFAPLILNVGLNIALEMGLKLSVQPRIICTRDG